MTLLQRARLANGHDPRLSETWLGVLWCWGALDGGGHDGSVLLAEGERLAMLARRCGLWQDAGIASLEPSAHGAPSPETESGLRAWDAYHAKRLRLLGMGRAVWSIVEDVVIANQAPSWLSRWQMRRAGMRGAWTRADDVARNRLVRGLSGLVA